MFVIPAEKQVVASADPAPYKYVAQLPLDSQLSKQTGQITRKRDPNYCLHAASAMCDNCMPLEPWDKAYLTNNKIKHLSFHSYLRQLKTSQKTCLPTDPLFIPPLDEPSYTLKSCSSHLPYPQGICSKCQIGAITLAPQTYRMVDHVEFESPDIIDTFINAWRANGHQRLGFLYGMYVAYPDVPLGVKAVVQAIYEPPQEASREHIQIQAADPIAEDPAVASLAGLLGMQRVGIIYTDLTDSGTGDGKVVYKRHIDSHFLSSAETLSSAMFQLNARVPTPYSSTGAFDSRFVTCVVTANAQNEIDLFTYQASNQCCQMAAAKLIHATVDPCKFRVKKQVDNPQVYIPQVFYTQKNSFGIAVQHDANPAFPVEYMLVNLTHGFPSTPTPRFTIEFQVENRNQTDTLGAISTQLAKSPLEKRLLDFHLLLALTSVQPQEFMCGLCVALAGGPGSLGEFMQTQEWRAFGELMSQAAVQALSGGNASSSNGHGEVWTCRHCTFCNERSQSANPSCEMCGLPRDQ